MMRSDYSETQKNMTVNYYYCLNQLCEQCLHLLGYQDNIFTVEKIPHSCFLQTVREKQVIMPHVYGENYLQT